MPMARRGQGPARQRNSGLIRELDRICRKTNLTVHGRADYRALARAAGLSDSGLEGIVKRNVVPKAETLIAVAHYAQESALWLMLAAYETQGFSEDDVAGYVAERDAPLVPRAIEEESLSPEALAAARRVIEGVLRQLELRQHAQLADTQGDQPGAAPLLPPPTQGPAVEESSGRARP